MEGDEWFPDNEPNPVGVAIVLGVCVFVVIAGIMLLCIQ